MADPFVQALEVVLLLLSQVLAGLLGFQTSANFVFVYVIAVLVMRDFSNTTKIAMLRKKIEGLIQEVALRGEFALFPAVQNGFLCDLFLLDLQSV